MNVQDIKDGMICEGDYVLDPLDNEYREICGFTIHDETDATVHLTDGGVMGIHECDDTLLESEYRGADYR